MKQIYLPTLHIIRVHILLFLFGRAIFAYNYTSLWFKRRSSVIMLHCFVEFNVSKFEICIMPMLDAFLRVLLHLFLSLVQVLSPLRYILMAYKSKPRILNLLDRPFGKHNILDTASQHTGLILLHVNFIFNGL
jgi:hypothetical protein